MLSNKMTFSLTILAMLIALGFAFTPAALAAKDTVPEGTFSIADVSTAGGHQVEAYTQIDTAAITDPLLIDTTAEVENLLYPSTSLQTLDVVFYLRLTKGVAALGAAEGLDISDLSVVQYNRFGVSLSTAAPSNTDSTIAHRNAAVPDGRNFTITIAEEDIQDTAAFLVVSIAADKFKHADPADVLAALNDKKTPKGNKAIDAVRIELVNQEPSGLTDNVPNDVPKVVSIVRVLPTAAAAQSRFASAAVSGPFDVRITFTEEPKDFTLAKITERFDIDNGEVTAVVAGTPFYVRPDGNEGNYTTAHAVGTGLTAGTVPLTTGRDRRYHTYLVTIAPKRADFVEIRVRSFDDLVDPPNRFTPPGNHALIVNRHLLRVPVVSSAVTDAFSDLDPDPTKTVKSETILPNEKFLPEEIIIPADGYLILAVGKAEQHGIQSSPDKVADRKGPQVHYGIKNEFGLPYPGTDLEAFFRAGGTIELYHRDIAGNTTAKNDDAKYQAAAKTYASGAVVISEIMWGSDVSLGSVDAAKSQWIELYNTTGEAIGIDKHEWLLAFIQGNGTGTTETYGMTLIDEVGNVAPSFWPAPGSDGATKSSLETEVKGGVGVKDDGTIVEGKVGSVVETFDLKTLTSMYRKIEGSTVMPGKSEASWAASTTAGSRNFTGLRAGTPGAETPYDTTTQRDADAAAAKAAADAAAAAAAAAAKVDVATATDLKITEIMVASNKGTLPQWIEITNESSGKVGLDGWQVSIDNDASDMDVITTSLSISLDGVVLDAGHAALVVSKKGRNSGVAARTKGDTDTNQGALDSNRIVDASAELKPAARNYTILSESAFRISLEPPSPITSGADVVGNLVGGWELPMSEGERSSIIRREMAAGAEIKGTDAAGWKLAADTSLAEAYVKTYYGDKDDEGTPGYNAGGALPVELSKFGAARDKATGQVVITWETQSELNNAGFFIKRSQHRTGQFQVVNPTMIAGAGTTSEKQSYTYTDTTAKPNIVYYYQIEDVSLDGNRQTLTRSHRLKGHIGAAGKLTTMWGELKEQQ